MFKNKKDKLSRRETETYIYYNTTGKNLESSAEIQMIYSSNNDIKLLMLVDLRNTTIDYLGHLVAENLEGKKGTFYQLEGLMAINIHKKEQISAKPNQKLSIFQSENKHSIIPK